MKSPLSWRGGKSRLAREVVARIPRHDCYAEPFAGAAWVLFFKDPSKAEVLNDINSDLVTLFRVLQNHLEEFVRHLKYLLCSREEFERFKAMRPETLTDIQRAVRFYFTQKLCFGGRVVGQSFGYSATGPPRLNLLRIEEELSGVHLRLARVHVENLPYADLVQRYDRPGTFFYCDPPYVGCEGDYGKGLFGVEDFARLADLMGSIKGKFLLSLNDTPEARKVFGAFHIEPVGTTYTCSNTTPKQARELFIGNY